MCMKNILLIASLLLWKLSLAQADACRPVYDQPLQYQQLPGTAIAYAEAGSGRPLLFIHGLGGNMSHWLKSVKGLSAGYRCIAVDLPGYGYSGKALPGEKDLLQYYADMLALFIKAKQLLVSASFA